MNRNTRRRGNGHVDQNTSKIILGHEEPHAQNTQAYGYYIQEAEYEEIPRHKTRHHKNRESKQSVKLEFTPPRDKKSSGRKPRLSPHRF
jgi:hypothetical protein